MKQGEIATKARGTTQSLRLESKSVRRNRAKALDEVLMRLCSGNYVEGWLIRYLGQEARSDTRTVKRFLGDCENENYLHRESFADGANRRLVILKGTPNAQFM